MSYVVIDKNTTFIDENSQIEDGAVIFPFTSIVNSKIGAGAVIKSFSSIENSTILKNATIFASVIESSQVCEGAKIGPFAHLRPNSTIMPDAKIGNFVETKNSTIGAGSKVSHLSYVGDADIGKSVNIGCGVVFVNFNGTKKQRSSIKDGAFIGSSVNVIAPVCVGEGAYVCAGTTINKNVEAGDFVIGRSRMQTKPGRAAKYLKGE